MGLSLKRAALACLTLLLAIAAPAGADGRLSPQGGTITAVAATAGGGLTGGGTGGPVYLGLLPCSTGQVLAWSGTAYACTDGSTLAIAGTVTHLPYLTPDGHHLADTPMTYSSGLGEVDAPVTRMQLAQGAPAGAPLVTPTATIVFGQRVSAATNVITLATPGDVGHFVAGVTVFASPNADGSSPRSGTTTVVSNDPANGTVTLTSAAAISGFANNDYLFMVGVNTGVRNYAYYEQDGNGTTPLSPLSSPITLTAEADIVTIGLPRPGMGVRHICATHLGGSAYYDAHTFSGGFQYFALQWIDNTPDSSLTVLCPTVDTTAVYTWDLADGVKFLRTLPSHTGAGGSDLTLVTSNPAIGSFAFDAYGPLVGRTVNGTGLELFKQLGTGSHLVDFYTSPVVDTGGYNASNAITNVWSIGADGATWIHPDALIDAGSTQDRFALLVQATLPAVTTMLHAGVSVSITGAGSSSFTQEAMAVAFNPGYTGSSDTFSLTTTNQSATTGVAYSLQGLSNGAATQNVGVAAIASAGTHNVPLYAGATAIPGNYDAMIVVNNGSTTNDLFLGIDSRSGNVVKFQVQGDGTVDSTGAIITADGTIDFLPNTNASTVGWVNFYSYSPNGVKGTTQFRDTKIGNGKGAAIVTVTGSTNAVDIVGAATADAGLRIFDSAGSGLASTANAVRLNINSGSTQTCGAGTAVTSLTTLGITGCAAFGSSSLTNGAGANVITKSDGTNLVASSVSDNATTVSTTENVSIGTASGVGKLSILTADPGTGAGTVVVNGLWDRNYSIFGPNVASTTGAALALAYSTTDSAAKIMSLTPGSAYQRMDFMASQFNWYNAGSLKATFNGTTFAITGGLTTTTTVAATGQVSGSTFLANTTNTYAWGDGTTKIAGSNTGAGAGSMQFDTNTTVRGKVDNAGLWTLGANTADAPGASNTTLIVSNLGSTCSEVRDSTNDVEAENCASSSGGFGGTFTNHSYFLQTNATNALKINTSQQVEALAAFLVDGNTTLGASNANTLTLTAKIADHVYYGGTAQVIGNYSCAGATMAAGSTDERGTIVTPDTSCVLTFTTAYTTNAPKCTANASSAIAVGVASTTTNVTFTMGSKPTSMTWACDGGL